MHAYTQTIKPFQLKKLESFASSVPLSLVKEHLRVTTPDEDFLLQLYIESATTMLEDWSGYGLMPAIFEAYFSYPIGCCSLLQINSRPFYEIQSVTIWNGSEYVELLDGFYVWENGQNTVNPNIDPNDESTFDYCVIVRQYDVLLKLSSRVQLHNELCPTPIKVVYSTGDRRNIDVTSIETAEDTTIANTTLDLPHELIRESYVILSDTGNDIYNGLQLATPVLDTTFTFTYNDLEQPEVLTGVCSIPVIPAPLINAVLIMVGKMYANRGDCSDTCGSIPCMAQHLAGQYKRRILKTSGC